MAVVGFEPTPPERLEPKSSALDHSATLPGSHAVSTMKNVVQYAAVLANADVCRHSRLERNDQAVRDVKTTV